MATLTATGLFIYLGFTAFIHCCYIGCNGHCSFCQFTKIIKPFFRKTFLSCAIAFAFRYEQVFHFARLSTYTRFSHPYMRTACHAIYPLENTSQPQRLHLSSHPSLHLQNASKTPPLFAPQPKINQRSQYCLPSSVVDFMLGCTLPTYTHMPQSFNVTE